MGLFSFIGKAATGAAAATATTVGGLATAVGGVATAVGGVATAVGGVVTAVGSVATTVGAKVTAGAAKVTTGTDEVAAGETDIYKYTEDNIEAAEDIGNKKGSKHGFAEDKVKATQDLQKLLEKNEKLRFGMFAMALFIARLDGEDDTELDYIEACLENEGTVREEVKYELQVISSSKYSFYEIRDKYLNDVTVDEILYVDKVIKGVIDADGTVSEKERQFYITTWQPYLRSLTKA